MNRTKIEYLTHTWNPIAMRCSRVSPGCDNCWALKRMKMLSRNPYTPTECKLAYAGAGWPVLKEKELQALSKIPDGSRVGVQFMGDLMECQYPIILKVFEVCKANPRHIFLWLTKRSRPMYNFFTGFKLEIPQNIWLGVSVETQEAANVRIAQLLEIDNCNRWVSVEPMLEEISIDGIYAKDGSDGRLHWVVCGAETGPGARPCMSFWKESLYEQCQKLRIPFFDKQGILPQEYPPFAKATGGRPEGVRG